MEWRWPGMNDLILQLLVAYKLRFIQVMGDSKTTPFPRPSEQPIITVDAWI